jgi:lysophospholipase L1-like esterase
MQVTRLPAGSSRALLADAEIWRAVQSARLVHVNVGLHDLKFDCRSRTHAVALEGYRKNVREILERLRGAGRTVIWATTTPVVDARRGVSGSPQNADFIRRNDDVRAFNTAAIDIARELGVERNDLYMAIVGGGAQHMIGPDGVHLVDAGYQVCAGHVAHALERNLRN